MNMDPTQLMKALTRDERDSFKIRNKKWTEFLYERKGKSKEPFKPVKMPVFLLLKHRNRGKIESHYWLFRGLSQYIEPDLI